MIHNFKQTYLTKYFCLDIFKVFLFIWIIFIVIMLANQYINHLVRLQQTGIEIGNLLTLISLKIIRDLAIVIPLSLFLAIIFSISRFYKNNEALVLHSFGLGVKDLILLIQPIAFIVFLVMVIITFFIVPWSKTESIKIVNNIQYKEPLLDIKAGKFHNISNSNLVFYASFVSDNKLLMKDIFIKFNEKKNINNNITIVAKEAHKIIDENNSIYLKLKNGTYYDSFNTKENYKIISFNEYKLLIYTRPKMIKQSNISDVRAKSIKELFISNNIKDKAELQWRIVQPLLVLFLSFLGFLLAKVSPKKLQSKGMIVGIILYFFINNMVLVSKSWLINSKIPEVIGIWWVLLLVSLLIFIFYKLADKNYSI